MKILVPVDGSAYTRRMLAYLAAHDEWLGDKHAYTIVHVAPAIPARAAAAIDKALLKAHYTEESEAVFKPIRRFFDKQRIQAEFVAKVGAPAETIAELSDKGRYDLLILGSHGHGVLGSLVLGSVTSRVIALCATPVLIVR